MRRVLVLRTYSTSCEPIFAPLRKMGWDVQEIDYSNCQHNLLSEMISMFKPAWILMLGTHDSGVGGVPPVEVLHVITSNYPTVHICCDGSEQVWWPQLEDYIRHCGFVLHVNIDGVATGPIARVGLTTLCPIDHQQFNVKPWNERSIRLGFCGSYEHEDDATHPRTKDIYPFIKSGLLTAHRRGFENYDGYRLFMENCQCVWNHAMTGSATHMHVKARCVETAFAGALLFEPKGSPLSNWVSPDDKYLEYENIDDMREKLASVGEDPVRFEIIARRLRNTMVEFFSAKAFYTQILERIGIQ